MTDDSNWLACLASIQLTILPGYRCTMYYAVYLDLEQQPDHSDTPTCQDCDAIPWPNRPPPLHETLRRFWHTESVPVASVETAEVQTKGWPRIESGPAK